MNPPSPPPAYSARDPASAAVASTAAEDRELLRRMAAGDERALGALYDRWVTLVHSLVVRIVGDADEAEDVVEETFWQAWRQAERYEGARGAVSTWLTTIARSRALDRVRARRRRQEDAWSELATGEMERATPAAPSADDPHVSAERVERQRLVAGALARLPAEQRDAIELAYFGGLSQSEIAERTGQPLGTVKTRVRLGMEKLRESLGMFREGAP